MVYLNFAYPCIRIMHDFLVDGNGLSETPLQAPARDAVQFGEQVHDGHCDGARQTQRGAGLREGGSRTSARHVQKVSTNEAKKQTS